MAPAVVTDAPLATLPELVKICFLADRLRALRKEWGFNPNGFSGLVFAKTLGNAICWVLAIAALLFAAMTHPDVTLIFFGVGYAARRVLPHPMRIGARASVYLALVVVTILVASSTHSWGPVLWFLAGWAAFATSFQPAN